MNESVTAATVPSTLALSRFGKLDFIRDIDVRPLLLTLCRSDPQPKPDKCPYARHMPSRAFSAGWQRAADGPINFRL
jgi:hypothetical protein